MKRLFPMPALVGLTLSCLAGCGVDWFPPATSGAATTSSTTTQSAASSSTASSSTASSSTASNSTGATVLAAATVAAFSFSPASVTGVPPGSTQTSDTVTVSVAGGSAPIGVSGGEYRINDAGYTSAAGTVKNGDRVTVRHSAAATAGETVTTLVIGDKSATFSSTTKGALESVTPFSFSPAWINGVAGGMQLTSSTVTVALGSGTTTAIGVTGGEYRINDGSYTSAAGTVNNSDKVNVRHTSGSVAGETVVTTLTIGNQSATFSSTATTSAAGS